MSMTLLLWIYLSGLLLTVALVAHSMINTLDEFDWQYHVDQIWKKAILSALFWPVLLLFKPQSLRDPGKIFDCDITLGGDIRIDGTSKRIRKLDHLAKAPPPCSSTIFYHFNDLTKADLWFTRNDVLSILSDGPAPLFTDGEEKALRAWLLNFDSSIEQDTKIPDLINFNGMAARLLDAGYGQIKCETCDKCYETEKLRQEEPSPRPGWNTRQYFCPEGHLVLEHRTIHIKAS